jgi:hypothetical protein
MVDVSRVQASDCKTQEWETPVLHIHSVADLTRGSGNTCTDGSGHVLDKDLPGNGVCDQGADDDKFDEGSTIP